MLQSSVAIQNTYASRPNQQIVITVLDSTGIRIAGIYCEVTVNSVAYSDITNHHGVAMITVPSSAGSALGFCDDPDPSKINPVIDQSLNGARNLITVFLS